MLRYALASLSIAACTEAGDSRFMQPDSGRAGTDETITETIDILETKDAAETTNSVDTLETTADIETTLEVAPETVADIAETTPETRACEDCQGFESATLPWTVVSPNCSGAGAIAIDTTVAHSGRQSLRVDGGGGYCDHVFAETSLPDEDRVWLRMWVRFDSAFEDGHVTFLTMRDRADNNKDLRMGGQSRIFMWNRESDDATLPELSPTGIAASTAPAPNTWTCIEAMIDSGRLETYVSGALVSGLVIDGEPTPDIDRQWLQSRPNWAPQLDTLRLGWESYAGKTMTVWFDDVAIGTDRIRCE